MVLIRVDFPSPVCPETMVRKFPNGYQAVFWEAKLTNADDVELETTLQQLALDLGCDTVETNMAARVHRRLGSVSIEGCHCCGKCVY